MKRQRASLRLIAAVASTTICACSGSIARPGPERAASALAPPIRITRLYAGADGESHFQDLEIAVSDAGALGSLSSPSAVSSIVFRRSPVGYVYDWHTAPRRQYVILLAGESEVEIGDGTKRRFGPGSIILAEDTTGHGHRSRSTASQPNVSIFVTLPEP